jgi:hypothetical protein
MTVLIGGLGVCASLATAAEPDDDLNLIPDSVLSLSDQHTANPDREYFRIKSSFDEVVAVSFSRNHLAVAQPDSPVSSWYNRMSLDVRAQLEISPGLSLIAADRLNHLSDEDGNFLGARIQNDLKECYVTTDAIPAFYLDVGRINVKNGVALGFNPTDYFKKNTIRFRISEDPGVLRENRLGTLMVRVQGIHEKGAVTLALAPQVNDDPDQWHTDAGSAGLGLERTNDHTRFLAKVTLNAVEDLNPEFLYFFDSDRSHFGINITRGVGDALVFYAEWSGANREHLISQSISESKDSNIMALSVPRLFSNGDASHFRNQLSVGFSGTESVNRTTYVEYHFNEAGLSRRQWDQWFDIGTAATALLEHPETAFMGAELLGQLWSPRKWARDAQEPETRHSLFFRTYWRDAMIQSLDLTGIADINLTDGSFFVQPVAEYHLGKNYTLSLTLNLFMGDRESEYGSLHPMGDLRAGMTCYF